jgi:hypothetical protein
MSLQATLDRFKEIQVTGKEFRAGVIGLLAGLLLGLLIGWVFWPVDWQGGDVGALSRDAQVDYLSAVADAYAGATSSSAVDLARQRLAPLMADLPALFDEAVERAAAQPDSASQVANLALLASSLGVSISAALPAATASGADPLDASTAADASANEGDIWASVLWVLLGVAIAGVGVYLLWRFYLADKLRQRRAEAELPLRATTVKPETGETTGAYDAGSASRRADAAVYRTAQAAATKVPPVQPPAAGEVTPFDDDDLSSPAPSSSEARQRASSFGPSIAVSASTTASTPDAFADDDDGWEEEPSSQAADASQTSVASTPRPGTNAPGWMAGTGRLERYQTIDRFHAEFIAGMQTFDWTRPIPGAEADSYAGEYGAGVSERHGMLNNDPDQVVAIEVYIFDKSEDKSVDNVNRIVLSEYADTYLRKQFERERDRLGPIVAQPNTTVQLETRQFVLLCTITDVVYSDEGIFKRVVMDMELKRKS